MTRGVGLRPGPAPIRFQFGADPLLPPVACLQPAHGRPPAGTRRLPFSSGARFTFLASRPADVSWASGRAPSGHHPTRSCASSARSSPGGPPRATDQGPGRREAELEEEARSTAPARSSTPGIEFVTFVTFVIPTPRSMMPRLEERPGARVRPWSKRPRSPKRRPPAPLSGISILVSHRSTWRKQAKSPAKTGSCG